MDGANDGTACACKGLYKISTNYNAKSPNKVAYSLLEDVELLVVGVYRFEKKSREKLEISIGKSRESKGFQ